MCYHCCAMAAGNMELIQGWTQALREKGHGAFLLVGDGREVTCLHSNHHPWVQNCLCMLVHLMRICMCLMIASSYELQVRERLWAIGQRRWDTYQRKKFAPPYRQAFKKHLMQLPELDYSGATKYLFGW